MGIIIPTTYVEDAGSPLIFLAGPIRGAPLWQDDAAAFLLTLDPSLTIASPRPGVRGPIAPYIATGEEGHFSGRRAWERHYLDIAAREGAILFWLPGEENHDCAYPYGQMTRVELGQWMTAYRHDPAVRFCVGSDGRFPGLSGIAYDLARDAPDRGISYTLEEACWEAIHLAWLP